MFVFPKWEKTEKGEDNYKTSSQYLYIYLISLHEVDLTICVLNVSKRKTGKIQQFDQITQLVSSGLQM